MGPRDYPAHGHVERPTRPARRDLIGVTELLQDVLAMELHFAADSELIGRYIMLHLLIWIPVMLSRCMGCDYEEPRLRQDARIEKTCFRAFSPTGDRCCWHVALSCSGSASNPTDTS